MLVPRAKGLLQRPPADLFNLLAYIASVAIILLSSWRYYIVDSQDPYKCGALQNSGQWLNSENMQNWSPSGCIMHQYNPQEISQCVNDSRILLVGDESVLQVFWGLARKLNKSKALELKNDFYEHKIELNGERYLSYDINGVRIEYRRDQDFSSTQFFDAIKDLQPSDGSGTSATANTQNTTISILLLGGTWPFTHQDDFKTIPSGSTTDGIRHMLDAGDNPNQAFLAPASDAGTQWTTADFADKVNKHLRSISASSVLWSYLAMAEGQRSNGDGALSLTDSAFDVQAEILLNMRCNAIMDTTQGYPFDRTCCTAYFKPGWIQKAAVLTLAFLTFVLFWNWTSSRSEGAEKTDTTFLNALLVLLATIAYCYAADRTQLFQKLAKQYSTFEFFLFCVFVLAAGVFQLRHSGSSTTGLPKDQPFLSRDQTEEWKGWMQFLILIYHWTGASRILGIYQIIRLLVASYLCLTGFGHTCYFLKRGDYSFKRVAAVLVRVNLLSCVLPYFLRTDYLFYYFAPLVSFWFLVIYATMRIYARNNGNLKFLIPKIVISAVLVSILIHSAFFPFLFSLGKYCNINWDAREWQFRLGLDRFIVYTGMLLAVAYTRLTSSTNSVPEAVALSTLSLSTSSRTAAQEHTSSSLDMSCTLTRYLMFKPLAIAISAIALTISLLCQAKYFTTKQSSNAIHPYLSSVPILSFIILRNSTQGLRNYHSVFFAWLGRFSLETFILQYHLWLAADTKARLMVGGFRTILLRLLPGQLSEESNAALWLDFVLLTVAFIWVSKCVADATGVLTGVIINGRKISEGEIAGNENDDEEKGFANVKTRSLLQTTLDGTAKLIWPNNLKARIAIILGALWFLNISS